MNLEKQGKRIIKTIASYFPKENGKIRETIALSSYAIMRSEKVNTAEIARYMGEINGYGFKANDMRIYRLLKSSLFQVGDRLWRGYFNYIFALLKENGLKKQSDITINVDTTTDRNDFLILFASVVFEGESIPLYFSMRKYPKKAKQMSQKKLEQAFFKALRHLLPDYYRYTIVADRGFGNGRIIDILENNGFSYILRVKEALSANYKKKTTPLHALPAHVCRINRLFIPAWKRHVTCIKTTKDDHTWFLVTSPKTRRASARYAQRFSIEHMFKNKKSAGFSLAHVFVTRYDRFKRLLFLSCIAYTSLLFTGLFIKNKAHPLKKNFFLHLNILSQFSD